MHAGRRLRAPDDLPVHARMSEQAQTGTLHPGLYDSEGRMLGPGGRPFTPEQAEAIARRDGSLLLSANAGSGKTSVMAERFVRSVLEDNLRPGRILAISFTDKAAGELRARIRARFMELGARKEARDLESAWISTFHGMCHRILRTHAVRAGLDPAFTVLDEADARALRKRAFEAALAGFLADERAEALDLVAAYGASNLEELICRVHDQLRSAGETRPSLPPARAEEPDPAELRAALGAARAELADAKDGAMVRRALRALESCERALAEEVVPLSALAKAEFKQGNAKALKGEGCTRYLEALADYRRRRQDAEAARAVGLLDELLRRHAEAYMSLKRDRGALDFDDLELLTRDLLRDFPAICASYRERFARIMVDEFQDTNGVQIELLELLESPRFVVGDELQSIYGFRHADVRIFRGERARLSERAEAAELARNFRSRPAILKVLDDAFGELHGEAHVPFEPGRDDPSERGGPLVELLLTDADAVEAWPEELLASLPGGTPARRAEARVVAERIARMVREEGVPPGDIVVLLRSAGDAAVFERAIEEQGLSTLASGGRGYWGRQQVADLCAYLAALVNPRDEPALFGMLASPLVGVSADGLAVIARSAGQGKRWWSLERAFCEREPDAAPVAELPEADRAALESFCPWFAAERRQAPLRSLDELLERVIERTGYDLHVLNLPGGRRRWANVLKLKRLAAGFEARRGRDVRGLIDLATAELEAGAREADAPVELGDASSVRLMTIHAAKGLEFPVVVVADLGRQPPRRQPDLLVDDKRVALRLKTVDGHSAPALGWEQMRDRRLQAEAEEELRILHVAMTRAEERLVLSGACNPGDLLLAPEPGAAPVRWLAGRLAPSLLALGEEGEPPAEPFDDDPDPDRDPADRRVRVWVRREPPASAPGAPASVAEEALGPGRAEPQEAGPGQLALDVGGPEPARAAEGSVAPDDEAVAVEPEAIVRVDHLSYSSLERYKRCPYRWYLERVLGLPEDEADPLKAGATATPAGLEGRMRGTLAHELLEALDLRASSPPDADAVRAVGARHGLELTDEQVADLQALVGTFIDGDLLPRLASAVEVRREHVFTVALGDERAPVLTGAVDVVAFDADGRALVVDYKTDILEEGADPERLVEDRYAAQRRIYALATLASGAPQVEVAHVFLAAGGAVATKTYNQDDLGRLRAEIRALADGIAAGRFEPSERPHRARCAGCPGRRGLCHHPPRLTARDAP